MPFQIVRDNIASVLCDAVVDTSAELGNHAASLYVKGARNHMAYDETRAVHIGKYKLMKFSNDSLHYVIHIPLPNKHRVFSRSHIIRQCYRRALRIVSNRQFNSVAFPLIGSECDDLSKEAALDIAFHEIKRFLATHADTHIILVISNLDTFQPDPDLQSQLSKCFRLVEEMEKQKKEQPIILNMVSTGVLPIITSEDTQNDQIKTHPTHDNPQATAPSTSQLSRSNESSWNSDCCNQKNADETVAKPGSVLTLESFLYGHDSILDESFSQMVIRKIDEKGFKKDSDCYFRANIDRRLFSRIRCDENYHPKKTTAVALAIALELTLEETSELLKKAGYSLSHSILFDVIIEYCIRQQEYDIFEVNKLLTMYNQPLLGA